MTFSQSVAFQFKKMIKRKDFYFAFLFSLIFLFATTILDLARLYGSDVITLSSAWMYFGFSSFTLTPYSMMIQLFMMLLLPFIASLTYSYCYFDDYNYGVSKTLFARVSRNQYYFSSALVTFLGAFFVVFIPLLLRELVFVIAVPLNSPVITPGYPVDDLIFRNVNFFKDLCFNHPYTYFFIYCLIPAFVSGLIGVLSFAISLFYKKNRFLVLTIPGIFYIVFCFVCSLTGNTGAAPNYLIFPSLGLTGIELTPLIVEIVILLMIDLTAIGIKMRFQKDEL